MDNDGIPDSLDPCPQTANTSFGGLSYCPFTLYSITRGEIGAGSIAMIDYLAVNAVLGSTVTLAVRVGDAAFDPFRTGDGTDPLKYSYIVVTWPTAEVPPIGARVRVFGTTQPNGALTINGFVLISLQ